MNKRVIVFIVIIAAVIYFAFKGDSWTLMVCKTKLNDAECQDNAYNIPGFKNLNQCMLEGASNFKEEGFECGKNCEDDGIMICDEICNSKGCVK